jgi:hypothetical protein
VILNKGIKKVEIISSIARILNSRNEVCGTGFLFGDGLLLTCYHVVCTALGSEDSIEKPDAEVIVDFPAVEPERSFHAKIVKRKNNERLDYIVLSPKESFPSAVKPVQTMTVGIEKTAGHPFLAFGFPVMLDTGISALGEIVHTDSRGWLQIESTKQVGQFIEKGFSGGPVVDQELGAVIGMIVAVHQKHLGVAFMIPLDLIAEDWPDLTKAAFETMQSRWRVPVPKDLERHSEHIQSPLYRPWDEFINNVPWDKQIKKLLSDILHVSKGFIELKEITWAVQKIDTGKNYETIRDQLLVMFRKRDLLSPVEQLLSQYEKRTGLSPWQIRNKRGKLSKEEERQLALDSVLGNFKDLQEKACTPEYGRCFFVIGSMGTGKTHFIGVDLLDFGLDSHSSRSRNALFLPLQSSNFAGEFPQLILTSLCATSGIHWPDLETFNIFLQAYQENRDRIDLFVIVDDLSHWKLIHDGFIDQMIDFIRETTQLNHLYWFICMPYVAYSEISEKTRQKGNFWTEYAGSKIKGVNYIDRWIVLDDLNQWNDIGISVILEALKRQTGKEDVQLAVTQARDQETLINLNNPLIAWVFLDLIDTLPVDRAMNLNYVEFIDAFWKKQLVRLASARLGQKIEAAPREDELQTFVIRTARFLSETKGVLFPRHHLLQAVLQMAENPFDFGDEKRVTQALELLTKSMLMGEHRGSKSLVQSAVPVIEIHFPSFWALLLANEILSQYTPDMLDSEFDGLFTRFSSHLLSPTLEFFLLLLDKQQQALENQKPTAAACSRILSSDHLPHSPVWLAGAKAGEELQNELMKRARMEAKKEMDPKTIVAFLYFLSEIPLQLLPVPARLTLFQPLYKKIRPGRYEDDYFLYVVERLFEMLDNLDELLETMVNLSGCEPVDNTDQLAEWTIRTMVRIKENDSADSEEITLWMLDYMEEVVKEYTDIRSIPRQEEGWQRYLYREFVMHHFLVYLCRIEREALKVYSLLNSVNWYDDHWLRTNKVLVEQMEREANIAIGKLFHYGSQSDFIDFAKRLVHSLNPFDRHNAYFILRHTEPITHEKPIPTLDPHFEPLLGELFLDPAIDDILKEKIHYDFFRKNLKHFKTYEQQRNERLRRQGR